MKDLSTNLYALMQAVQPWYASKRIDFKVTPRDCSEFCVSNQ